MWNNNGYYVIHYYDPNKNQYFDESIRFSTREEAIKHARTDIYFMVEFKVYTHEEMFEDIFSILCEPISCSQCTIRDECDHTSFSELPEDEKLHRCAALARTIRDLNLKIKYIE